MLLQDIPSLIIDLLTDPILQPLIIIIIIMVLIAVGIRRSRGPSGSAVVKKIHRMKSDIEREKPVQAPEVPTRREKITELFGGKMQEINLVPSTESGYIPVSYTPLARFLGERGLPEAIVGAILAGLKEEESEEDVRAIIDAAADTPDIDLTPEEVEKVKDLAVEEWSRTRSTS